MKENATRSGTTPVNSREGKRMRQDLVQRLLTENRAKEKARKKNGIRGMGYRYKKKERKGRKE